ncbi:hypothetical protein P43SY_003385 [Pythium insidiosum]|uniref:VPS9 domain-containing protein n=1 Tax=Pythium insidiosum TaxID=114742 RepID=A0AAD5M0D6_PYTIN|nr:hypothetical protein P43SY_003385 [Pythium insidiosum]
MDRTSDFVKISLLFDTGDRKPQTHRPLSQDARRAQQIADQLRQQELFMRDLQELVTKKSIIGDDPTPQIATLTDVLKKELAAIDKTIQLFQQHINAQRGMYTRMATMVAEQGEIISRIDDDMNIAQANVEAAHGELLKLYSMVSSNRSLIIKIFIVLLLVIFLELRVFVYHTVNDTTSPEGKACAKFLTKLRQNGVDPGKNLLEEVGTILDGVQEYMLEHRFDEMRTHVERLMRFFSSADLAEETQGRRNSYVSNLFNDDDVLTSNDKLHQLISDAIRHELEENICVPLMSELLAFLRMRVLQKERQFRLRVAVLRGQPQSYFGIPVNKISVSSWRSVIELIKEIDDAFLPQDKMRKLVATAHQIHSLHRNERRMCRQEQQQQQQQQQQSEFAGSSPASGSDEDDVLSGDDFLPIFIYVIVHANLSAPIMTQVLLNRLCDPEQRRSESGYYLATYEAALHHILSEVSFPDA